MAYQMTATAVTVNDLEGHSQVAALFKSNPSNICAAFYRILTDIMLARSLCVSRASCMNRKTTDKRIVYELETRKVLRKIRKVLTFFVNLRPLDM